MNFQPLESLFSRQRCRQWTPFITQQLRLRHVQQVIGFNLGPSKYYFTLHLTTMSAPLYTSGQAEGPHPKWPEIDVSLILSSASGFVIRIWRKYEDNNDQMTSTWGVNLSGLLYLGSKLTQVQSEIFRENSLVFCMQGGYFTSHKALKKPTESQLKKHLHFEVPKSEILTSYCLEKLRKLHLLQVTIRKKREDVENLRKQILARSEGSEAAPESQENVQKTDSNIRYAPQLLTMSCLNKMLHEKPTKHQKQMMLKTLKEIETFKYRAKLLGMEKDRHSAKIRKLKSVVTLQIEDNEEKESKLMENYHTLNKEIERVKEHKMVLLQQAEVLSLVNEQLQHRRRQLLKELLFIYPITKNAEGKDAILGIVLPPSNILPDVPNHVFSIPLGYIAHILVMCSSFLQVPLRYPLNHYGSRSTILDVISDRDYPLFTKGKAKAHFDLAVYLLNKNIAQFRWLFYMNTENLPATLPNLLEFLSGDDVQHQQRFLRKITGKSSLVSLSGYGSSPNVHDPILENLRLQQPKSPLKKRRAAATPPPVAAEVLAIPEAFLNRQISSNSFRSYATTALLRTDFGVKNSPRHCDITVVNTIEQGTDPLNTPSMEIVQRANIKEPIISKSMESYSSAEDLELRFGASLELGSEPLVNEPSSSDGKLRARTEALQKTSSFNLVKPKSN